MKIMTPEEIEAEIAAKKTPNIVAAVQANDLDLLRITSSTQLIMDYAERRLPWVQKPFILRGEVTIVVGAANLGKTTFMLQMLWRGATGKPWFLSEKPGATFRSLYFSLEMGEHPLSIRLQQMFGGGHENVIVATPPALVLTAETWDAIGRVVKAQSIDVVVIDNLLGLDLGFDLNKMQETSRLMNDARAFAQLYSVAVVLIHHTRKGQTNDAVMNRLGVFNADGVLDEAAGSKVIVNRAGIRLFLQKRGNSRRLFVYSRFGPQRTIRLGWDKSNHIWRRSSRDEESGESSKDEVEDAVEDDAEQGMIRGDDTKLDPTPARTTGIIPSSHDETARLLVPRFQSDGIRNMIRMIRKGQADGLVGPLWAPIRDAVNAGLSDAEIVLKFTESSP